MSHYKPYPAYKDSGVEWIGQIPEHWRVKRLRHAATLNPSPDWRMLEQQQVVYPFFPMDAIGEAGELDSSGRKPLDECRSGYTYFAEGDVAYAKVTPCFENGKGAVMRALDGGHGFGTTELTVLRPTAIDRNYLYALTLANSFRQLGASEMLGSGGLKRVPDEFTRNYLIALPPPAEQAPIAAALDRETARIDALIAKKTGFIELLKEKRQALITHAVTKGLDPNVTMKDSSVAWLGEVPEHWVVSRLKRMVRPGTSISYGIVQPGEPQSAGVPFVQTTNMTNGKFELADLQQTTAEIASAYPRSKLEGGEVLLGIRASIGAAVVAPQHLKGANLSRGVARIECGDGLSSAFLVHWFTSATCKSYWELAKQGSTFNEVSIETVREMPLLVPPVTEQQAINEHLRRRLARLELLSIRANDSVNLLKERRSALITAAVTGQIDLREEAA